MLLIIVMSKKFIFEQDTSKVNLMVSGQLFRYDTKLSNSYCPYKENVVYKPFPNE